MPQILVEQSGQALLRCRARPRFGGRRKRNLSPSPPHDRGARPTCRSRSRPASCSASSDRTAPASRRRSRFFPGFCAPTAAASKSAGSCRTRSHRHVERIGVVFGQRTQLWWDLPVIDARHAAPHLPCRAARRSADARRAGRVARPRRLLDQPVRQFRLASACAPISRRRSPRAAHPVSRRADDRSRCALEARGPRVREALNRERGVTVILTTHDMDDIEALCERVIVIGDGAILADGTFDALRARIASEHSSDDKGCRTARDRGSDRAVLSLARRRGGMSVELARPYVAGVFDALPADAAVPRRGGRGLRDAVLVGRDQGDDLRGVLP